MTYALIVDGAVSKYPYSFRDLRSDNPQVSYPREPSDERLAEFGVHAVGVTEKPAHDPVTQNVVEGVPVFSGGQWVQSWTIVPATAEEIASRQVVASLRADTTIVLGDTFVSNFMGMTPAQVGAYVDNNTGSLAETRALLKKMALMLQILARRSLR